MLKRVIVFGAHSYIGFGLCERFLSEGVEVKGILLKPQDQINKQLLDERLMMVGRNALFHSKEFYERTGENEIVDMIIHCCDDGIEPSLIEQDRINVKKSVELAKELNVPYIFITSRNKAGEALREEHIKFCEHYLSENIETHTFLQLPILFGPFQPPSEQIHQFLINLERVKEEAQIIDGPLLYIEDAVAAIWDLLANAEQGKKYSFLSKVNQEEKTSFSLELQMNVDNSQDGSSEMYFIKQPTSLEKGLKAQAAFIEKYREILNA